MRAGGARLGLAIAASLSFVTGLAGCPASGRDVVPESRESRGEVPDASSSGAARGDGYAYVARRAHGVVGLVGAHHVADADAQRLTDRVADDLESCARRLEALGDLVEGAAQLVAVSSARGTADISDVRFAPGGPVAANALECLIAPLRAAPFPAGNDAGIPAIALDATWAPLRNARVDAGAPR